MSDRKEYMRKYRHERRELLLKLGLCVACGKQEAMPNRQRCADCSYKHSEHNIAKWRNISPEERERSNARAREIRAQHIAQGLCTKCCKPLYAGSNCYCYEHLLKARRIGRECYARKIANRPAKEKRIPMPPKPHKNSENHPWRTGNRAIFGTSQ